MKREVVVTAAIAAALAFCAGLGAAGCVISAFGLVIERFPALVLTCLLAACLSALAFSWKRGGALLLLAAALAAGYLWRRGEAAQQLLQLIYRISYVYDRAYHWGYLQLTEGPWDAGTADLPMAILGAMVAAAVAWSVCRKVSPVFSIVLALLPLELCMVVTDTVPAPPYLFALLLPLLLLLLTSHVRQGDPGQANRLTLLAALPVAAALAGLFLAVPQEGYVNRSAALQESIIQWFQALPQTLSVPESIPAASQSREPEQVDLAALGRHIESTAPIMYVTAETGGTVYLRGQDYDVYDGLGWQSTAHRAEDFSCPGTDLGDVTVKTVNTRDSLYLPYYPAQGVTLVGGRIENTRLYTEYTYARSGLAGDLGALLSQAEAAPERPSREEYLALPQSAQDEASVLAEGILRDEATATAKAEAIGTYVRESAVYDLNTGRMPSGEKDFALWFLKNSDRGYCVHFATAAVVLLRAAGIEARYVSGYMVRTRAGETVTVTGENAHAWAEYYEPALGIWLVLEATPGAAGTVPEPPATTQPPETATEPQTQPETRPQPTASAATEASSLPPAPPETETVPEPVPEETGSGIWSGIGKTLLLLTAVAALTEGQRRFRLRLRKAKPKDPNTQALSRWQETERLAKFRREAPPEELERLAQKAKFSQHTLTPEELLQFEAYQRKSLRILRQRPWYCQILYRYIYALY